MTILSYYYAGHEDGDVYIPTLEIKNSSFDPIRTCAGYEDTIVTLETGVKALFPASGLDVALPAQDSSGQQNLAFAIENVTGIAQAAIRKVRASASIEPIRVILRFYFASNLDELAMPPIKMELIKATFKGSSMQALCSYMDPIGSAYLRKRYTAEFAPGIKHIG